MIRIGVTYDLRADYLALGMSEEETAEFIRQKRIRLETLSRARFPHVVDAAGPLSEAEDPSMTYGFGIDLFVAGVEALADRR